MTGEREGSETLRWKTYKATGETWPVRLRLAGGDGWVKGRLKLTDRGLVVWAAKPFRQVRREDVQAVTSESILARLVLSGRGWPVV